MCVLVVYSGQNEFQTSQTLSSSLAVDPLSQWEWLWVCGRKDTVGLMSQETRLRQLSCSGRHSSTVINQRGAMQDTADFPKLGQRQGILLTCTVGGRASLGLNTTNDEDFGLPGLILWSRFICFDVRSLSTFCNRLIKWLKLQTAAAAAVKGCRLLICCLFCNFRSSRSAACPRALAGLLLTFWNWFEPSGETQTSTEKTQQSCSTSA